MTTTPILIQTLSDSLGLERRVVDWTARQLRENGLLPTGRRGPNGAAEVTVEHAVNLLLALMVPQSPRSAPDSVKLYRDLPLRMLTKDSEVAACPATLGNWLDAIVGSWQPKLPHGLSPTALYIAAEPNAHAWVGLNSLADHAGSSFRGSCYFGVDPDIPGWPPLLGDGRVVHLGRYAMVPAGIFDVLSKLVGGVGRELDAA